MKLRSTFTSVLIIICIVLSSTTYARGAGKPYTVGLNIIVGTEAFKAEMTRLGYVEGQDITYVEPSISATSMEEFMAQSAKFIQSLVDAKADAIVVNTDTDAATNRATIGNIPVVFARSDDPVATGAVKSLLTPGGFSTGIITNKPHERRLQILTEMKPTTKKVYYLYSPLTQDAQSVLQQVQAVGKQLNVEIVPAAISDAKTMTEALEKTPDDVDWFFLTPYVFFDPASFQKLTELSISHHAGICGVTDSIYPGYLMGYGPSLEDTGRQAAQILDRILRGASPADLPVETAENYLTVNLEAAQAIDLKLPLEILRQANLIIRPGDFAKTPMPNASEATATPGN